MRSVVKHFLWAAVGLGLAATCAASGDLPGRLVMAGEWHGQEVQAQDGETWLALVHDPHDQWGLLRVNIDLVPVHDEILDRPGKKTGSKVTIPAVDAESLVLINDLSGLQPGPVPAADIGTGEIRPGRPAVIRFAGTTYAVAVACPDDYAGEDHGDCPLVLTDGATRQELQHYSVHRPGSAEVSFDGDGIPWILWAGDLDHDGRLDLLIDLTTHYNRSAPTLLLSSEAQKGELARPVAAFVTTGC